MSLHALPLEHTLIYEGAYLIAFVVSSGAAHDLLGGLSFALISFRIILIDLWLERVLLRWMSDLLNRIFLTEPIDAPLTRLSLRTIVPADTLRTLGLLMFGNTNELVTLRNIVVLHGVGHSER